MNTHIFTQIISILIFTAVSLFAKVEITDSGRIIKDSLDMGTITDALVNNMVSEAEVLDAAKTIKNETLIDTVKKSIDKSNLRKKQLVEITIINKETQEKLRVLGKTTAKKIATFKSEVLAEYTKNNKKVELNTIDRAFTDKATELENEKTKILADDLIKRKLAQNKSQTEKNAEFAEKTNKLSNDLKIQTESMITEYDKQNVMLSADYYAQKNIESENLKKSIKEVTDKFATLNAKLEAEKDKKHKEIAETVNRRTKFIEEQTTKINTERELQISTKTKELSDKFADLSAKLTIERDNNFKELDERAKFIAQKTDAINYEKGLDIAKINDDTNIKTGELTERVKTSKTPQQDSIAGTKQIRDERTNKIAEINNTHAAKTAKLKSENPPINFIKLKEKIQSDWSTQINELKLAQTSQTTQQIEETNNIHKAKMMKLQSDNPPINYIKLAEKLTADMYTKIAENSSIYHNEIALLTKNSFVKHSKITENTNSKINALTENRDAKKLLIYNQISSETRKLYYLRAAVTMPPISDEINEKIKNIDEQILEHKIVMELENAKIKKQNTAKQAALMQQLEPLFSEKKAEIIEEYDRLQREIESEASTRKEKIRGTSEDRK